ncbi:hypothetical protein FB45DRAFT_767454, partial [Roridomyces roridus]
FWSSDPSGLHPLSLEDAASCGFPEVKMQTEVTLLSWDDNAYDALRKFHAANGFDPNTQELTIHLGHPLFSIYGNACHCCSVGRLLIVFAGLDVEAGIVTTDYDGEFTIRN